ncbi:MAG: ribbon-helix-helix protein, CopG family [Solirubrobacterales bacterium]|nr:ribbon-helix-helix protein, CopG family [Solirubrobacterales bacterium]
MAQIAVRLSDDELAALDEAVAAGRYPSRAAAVRAGLAALGERERRREIAEAYREAYERLPQDEWFAESVAAMVGGRLAGERAGH